MDTAARVTSKGQVTVPKVVRDALGFREGDKIVFRVEGSRAVGQDCRLSGAGRLGEGAGEQAQRRVGRHRPQNQGEGGGVTAVTAYVDTNIVIGHLTGDPPETTARTTANLRAETELLLTDLVAAETVYVLESFNEAPRTQIADAVRSPVGLDAVIRVDPARLVRAIEVYETESIDFAEAYLVACAETTAGGKVACCDGTLDRVDAVQRIEPPILH